MRDHRSSGMLALGLWLAMAVGCGGQAPPPVAQRAAAAPAGKHPASPEPLSAHPIMLRKPAIEPLPVPVALPKQKFAEALKQAQRALNDGRLDERSVPSAQVPPAPNDVNAPTPPAATLPSDALALYRGVLATDPSNAAALHGMDVLVAGLRARAQAALLGEDMVSAQRDADRLKLLHPDDPDLPELAVALNKGWRVAALIEHGQRLEHSSAQIPSRSTNAVAAYRQALAINPDNASAQAGLARVEGVFIGKALAEAKAGHYPQSDRWIAQAATVRQDSQALQDASARIVAIRQHAAAVLQAQADTALASGDPDGAERLLKQIERAAPLSPEARDLRVRIVLQRNYGMFKPGQAFTESLVSAGRTPEMIVLPIGRFRMGSRDDEPDHEANETPQHDVAFKHGFSMARTAITVEQFGRFVQATHYRTDAERNGHSMVYDEVKGKLEARDGVNWRDDHNGQPVTTAGQPVMHVSWNDAEAYTIWLSKETAHLYRLPSEAEFEYALRAGGTGAYPWPGNKPPQGVGNLAGSDASPSGRHWGDAFASYSDGYWGPSPVAHFSANAFGLFDMVGNLSEWTQDCWHDSYRRAPADGSAWVNPGCNKRVVRGASWASSPRQARSAYRAATDADGSNGRIGFRVVREL